MVVAVMATATVAATAVAAMAAATGAATAVEATAVEAMAVEAMVVARAAAMVEGARAVPTTGCTGPTARACRRSPLGHCWIAADKFR